MFASEILAAARCRAVIFHTAQGDLYSNIDGDLRLLLDADDFARPLPAIKARSVLHVARTVYSGASRDFLNVLDFFGGGLGF